MARIDIVMPQMGESITNGTITKWNKAPGEEVDVDDILFEISTDKVESEIPSPVKGRLVSHLFKEGETVDVGIKVAEIEDDPNDDIQVPPDTDKRPTSTSPKAPEAPEAPTTPENLPPPPSSPSPPKSKRRFYTPLVKAMAKAARIPLGQLDTIQGSGAGGRVNKADFQKFLASQTQTTTETPVETPVGVPGPGSGPVARPSSVEVIPMDNMRKAIAKNMVLSKQTAPHVNSVGEVDLTHLVSFRENFKETFFKQEGLKITYTPFIMYAIIQALRDFPYVNASIEGDNIILKKEINLGCAVAVPGNGGLVVPVIKNADTLNVVGLTRTLNALANKARAKKLTLEDLSGGTFTFSNVGSFGTILATPVILPPQVGIYASGVIQKRVVAMEGDAGDVIAIRHMMYGTHTYDHRLIDGEMGGLFLEAVHRHLQEMKPATLF